ncbi:pyridoxine 5'-phosphate synthase [Pontiella sulfatireligans]|uniref:Pyridoxine 5'-phosphate synthase n=1 Tax=Pontiella sulfatireligans TaxID=2750658 RepID=A0A6C2UNH3_9BACT|nr:pyridoxine 5'-phosphate synthase [Pontiella sulfatireligans]VGO21815.1 Pyridoxine 5'-phosphate synthase [Pontiella sulfatireligans]
MKLGVNIDHIATLRQARGTVYPDPLDAAILCARAGAHGITAHLREDRRHIQDDDIYRLKELQPLPLNLEMANVESIVEIALNVKPAEVCLVPEKRQELTTEGGLDVIGHFDAIKDTVQSLTEAGIEVSLFVDADEMTLAACKDTGAPVVELHTGAYCNAEPNDRAVFIEQLIRSADYAHGLGLKVNAGHGINLENLGGILCIPHLAMLNIGHSIVCRAVFEGLENAVGEMFGAMQD